MSVNETSWTRAGFSEAVHVPLALPQSGAETSPRVGPHTFALALLATGLFLPLQPSAGSHNPPPFFDISAGDPGTLCALQPASGCRTTLRTIGDGLLDTLLDSGWTITDRLLTQVLQLFRVFRGSLCRPLLVLTFPLVRLRFHGLQVQRVLVYVE